jgi:hypothetical protein
VLVYGSALVSLHPSHYVADHPGARAPVGLALFVAYEIAVWFMYYRNDEGYLSAACTGFLLLAPAVAELLVPQVTDRRTDMWVVLVSIYLSGSHFSYAIANWRKVHQSWLDL